jgi:hypothetical protein
MVVKEIHFVCDGPTGRHIVWRGWTVFSIEMLLIIIKMKTNLAESNKDVIYLSM